MAGSSKTEILVMYHNGALGFVPSALLTHQLSKQKIKKFLRKDGWAVVGVHPVRCREQMSFVGPERRSDRVVSPKIIYL
ncbi:MAG TPA: hypothetical protein VJ974_07495 [Geopsychrobacteraceae bacterium]|nr:hypothetical protein [Geopsychrobacteraceae bacterium]